MVLLGYMAVAFKAWMFIDALRRRVPPFWYLVLVLPLGDVVYFFAVKSRDYGVRPAASEALSERAPAPAGGAPAPANLPPSGLATLEQAVAESPSFLNRVKLGWGLLEAEQPGRAEEQFRHALRTHRREKEALFGLGVAQLEQDRYPEAIETLQPLVERSLAYQDYEAALALAEALYRADRREDALSLVRTISRDSDRLDHLLGLAKYQMRAERREHARATLERAIEAFEAQPEFLRRQNGALATEARKLLRALRES